VKFPGRLHVCSRHETEPNRCPLFRLHGQGILESGKRVVIEGVAEDGTIEAIRIADAQASRSACSGTPNTIRSAIRSTGRGSPPSGRRWWPADELPKTNST
jgi:Peptidase C26